MATPMMEQFHAIKDKNKDTILFYRMGDFYEMFEEDAVIGSKILGITLTARNHGGSNKTPLCGFPHHAIERYTHKMISAGYKVAVCEQIEDPKLAKGLVKRDIIEVITAGTSTEAALLDDKSNNYIVSLFLVKNKIGIAIADVSTGEFSVDEISVSELDNELERLKPAEILLPEEENKTKNSLLNIIQNTGIRSLISSIETWRYSLERTSSILKEHFKTANFVGFGLENLTIGISAAGTLFEYIKEQKRDRVGHIRKLSAVAKQDYMSLDASTLRNLEIITPLHAEDINATLISVIDKTCTAMGGRLLKNWAGRPLLDTTLITNRLEAVELLVKDPDLRTSFAESLSGIVDIERLNSKIGYERVSGRDLISLKRSLLKLPYIKEKINNSFPTIFRNAIADFDSILPVVELLENALLENMPSSINDSSIFKPGYDAKLDEINFGAKDGKEWIANLQPSERKRTGIPNLKVSYNRVFGYYIDVSNSQANKIPEDYECKQTLVNSRRFITTELKKWESIVLGAEERRIKHENYLFERFRKEMLFYLNSISAVSSGVAIIDVLYSLAETASLNNYTKPNINNSGKILITAGRHPVIEQLNPSEDFIPNDTTISSKDKFIHLITGPNMAGKSTYLRQTGLITLMAQMGSFVPAEKAEIGVTDRIFTRVGASDRLVKGLSTFLVEMQELANILNNSTSKSLILLDEVGRGTSTFDGLSIAWSAVEYLHNRKDTGAKTLFATHYHELVELESLLKGVKNYNISVKEWNDEIIFLRKIVEGGSDHSYGIQVAQLAGVPSEVIIRAKEILNNLEDNEFTIDNKPRLAAHKNENITTEQSQLSFFAEQENPIVTELRKLDVSNITPLDALIKLSKLKEQLNK